MASDSYSYKVAFVYIFNLIVGAGIFALPKAFSDAGLATGTILIIVVCILNYLTASFVIEALAATNAYKKKTASTSSNDQDLVEGKELYQLKYDNLTIETGFILTAPTNNNQKSTSSLPHQQKNTKRKKISFVGFLNDSDHDTPSNEEVIDIIQNQFTDDKPLEDYEILENFEYVYKHCPFPLYLFTLYRAKWQLFSFPKLALFFNLQYLCFCLFSWGNLAYFNVIISTSLAFVTCQLFNHYQGNISNVLMYENDSDTDHQINFTNKYFNLTDDDASDCIPYVTYIRLYYTCLAMLLITIGPFTFCKMTTSKVIQAIASVIRFIGCGFMIILAVTHLIIEGKQSSPSKTGHITTVPVLYGIVIYSFKCQECLPGTVTPMSSKKHIYGLLLSVFVTTLLLYISIAYTGVFAFPRDDISALYHLTFLNPTDDPLWRVILGTFLALLPVVTLGSCYPIYAITRRDNLKALTINILERCRKKEVKLPPVIDRLLFPLLALIPSAVIAYTTQQVDLLVSITGSIPGVGIQIVIPAALVLAAQYKMKKQFGVYDNPYKTILSKNVIVTIILIWSLVSAVMICISMAFDPPSIDNYRIS